MGNGGVVDGRRSGGAVVDESDGLGRVVESDGRWARPAEVEAATAGLEE